MFCFFFCFFVYFISILNKVSARMNSSNFHLYILVVLVILLIIIYLCHNRRELFTAITQVVNNPIINLPGNDIHFITDNNSDLIDIPLFNYKLQSTINSSKQHIPEPSNIQNIEKFSNLNLNKTDSKGTDSRNGNEKYLSVFQHKSFDIYKGLGQYVISTSTPFTDTTSAIKSVLDKKCLNFLTSSPIKPIGYTLVWTSDLNADNKIFSVWSPIPPSGCIALGDIIVMGTEQPSLDLIACYPITMLDKTALSNGIIWKASNDMGKMCYCWGVGNIDMFKCSNTYSADMPELQSVYNLSSSVLTSNTVGNGNSNGKMTNKLENLQEEVQGITV